MKTLILHCQDCGKQRRFAGKTVVEILAAIDAAGWVDGPADNYSPGHGQGYCPDCQVDVCCDPT